MKEIGIRFEKIEDIKRLVSLLSGFSEDIDGIKGSIVVDAKSLIGMMGLAGSDRLSLLVHSNDTKNLERILTQEGFFCDRSVKSCYQL